MKLIPSILLIVALLAPRVIFAQYGYDYKPVPRGWVITGEAAGAVVAGYGLGIVSTIGTGLLLSPLMNDQEWGGLKALAVALVLSGVVVVPAGSALGARTAGFMMHDERAYWPALLGSGCGLVAGGVVGVIATFLPRPYKYVGFAACAALPPAGAVVGYNLGRPTDAGYGGFGQRLEVPRMAMTMTRDDLNRPVSGVRCDLVALRF